MFLPYLVCHFQHVQPEKEKMEKEKMEEKEESVKKEIQMVVNIVRQ